MAVKRYGSDITPTAKANGNWNKSYSTENNVLYLWFNTPDHSTHIMSEQEVEGEVRKNETH